MPALLSILNSMQQRLAPHMEENIGSLTEKGAEPVRTAELARLDRHIIPSCVRVRGAAFAGAVSKIA